MSILTLINDYETKFYEIKNDYEEIKIYNQKSSSIAMILSSIIILYHFIFKFETLELNFILIIWIVVGLFLFIGGVVTLFKKKPEFIVCKNGVYIDSEGLIIWDDIAIMYVKDHENYDNLNLDLILKLKSNREIEISISYLTLKPGEIVYVIKYFRDLPPMA